MKHEGYPFQKKLREHLNGKTIEALARELGVKQRWIYDQNMTTLSVPEINAISSALDFNFMEDYNKWLLENSEEPLYILGEPIVPYQKKEKTISTSFKITTTLANAEENAGKVLNAIRMDCEKYGYEFDLL